MRSVSRRRFLGAASGLLLAALILPLMAWPASADEHRMGGDHRRHKAMLKAPHDYKLSQAGYTTPGVTLLDMNGVKTALPDAFAGNTPVLVDFIFTTCTTICPVMSAIYADAQEMLKQRGMPSKLVSVSIDPEYDSPARLRAYAERFGARPEWRLFTGDLTDIVNVQKAFGAYYGDKANHVPLLIMRRSPEAPWVRIEGFASAAQVVGEVHRMMMASGGGYTH